MLVRERRNSLAGVTTIARDQREAGTRTLSSWSFSIIALSVATIVLLVAASAVTDNGAAWAALPSPTISDLHVTNFNPFAAPAGATFDATSATFAPEGAGFDSQGFDFINQFTNNAFTLSVDGYHLDFEHTYGLCGGMTYAALDTFLAGNGTSTPPGSQTGSLSLGPGLLSPPESGPVFDYLYTRQLDSLEASNFGAVREMLHMMVLDPYESERERETTHYFGGITRSINAGQPVPLLLVEALNPSQVFDNHQVLATGYFYRGGPQGQLVVQVYDPNFPGRFMYLNTHNTYNDEAQYPSEIETYDAAGSEYSGLHFYGFFTTPYSYVAPPWALAKPTGNLINDPGADWTDSTWNLTTSTGGAPPGSIETPSSELGQPAGGTSVIAPPDWTPTGSLTVVQYAEPQKRRPGPRPEPGFLSAAYGAAIEGGQNYFAGGPANSASGATQVINLDDDSALDALIDAGHQVATLSADLGGSGTDPAEMTVMAGFQSAAGAALERFSIGPVSVTDRHNQTELLARSAAALIPKGTRTIDVTMSATGSAANQYNAAFADNLSLTIATNQGISVPGPTPTVPVTIR
jgi:hypothetical protein